MTWIIFSVACSTLIFGCFYIIYGEETLKKIENDRKSILKILEKVEELEQRLNNHKL